MILPNGQITIQKHQYHALKETAMKEWFYGLPIEQAWEEVQECIHIVEDEEMDEIE